MEKTTFMEKQKKQLVKKFHTLLGKAHLDDDGKHEILAAYGAASSLDLDCKDLMEICDRLYSLIYNGGVDKAYEELNQQRKRLLAAGCKFMRENAQEESFDYVKAIACRQAKKKHFNEIPLDKLRAITYSFNNRAAALRDVRCVAEGIQGFMLNQKADLN